MLQMNVFILVGKSRLNDDRVGFMGIDRYNVMWYSIVGTGINDADDDVKMSCLSERWIATIRTNQNVCRNTMD